VGGKLREVLDSIGDAADFFGVELTDVNQRGVYGNTPLKIATVRGDIDAVRVLPFLLAGPLVVALTVLNTVGHLVLGVFGDNEVVFLVLGALLLLWMPGVSRLIGQPLYARLAAARYRLSARLTGEDCETGTCALHAPRR